MTHKQWFNNVLHLHPVHQEGAIKSSCPCLYIVLLSPKEDCFFTHCWVYVTLLAVVSPADADCSQGRFMYPEEFNLFAP